jgi:DNA-binding response OmpR family regulator
MLQVLLVDDSPLQLEIRQQVLREAGFPVVTAMTAEQALGELRDGGRAARFGVIVTDHILPGDSGAVFVRQLRELHSQIPVIVVTGLAEAEEEYDGLNVTFLHKPCPPEELIRQVGQALRK